MADYDLQYTGAQIDGLLDAANELKTAGYIYKGVATPSTNPGTPTERVAYLASEPGTYTNFGGIVITSGLYSLTYAGGTWTGTQMQAGSDIEVVQTTGQSTSDVMSQKAVTDEIVNIKDNNNIFYNIDIPSLLVRKNWVGNIGEVVTTDGSLHYSIDLADCQYVNIVAGVTNAYYTWASAITWESWTSLSANRYYVEAGTNSGNIPVPSGAKYIIIGKKPNTSEDYTPASISLVKSEINKAVSPAVDLSSELKVINGTPDLDVTDDVGNVILRLIDGHIITKNFDSRNVANGGYAKLRFANWNIAHFSLGDGIVNAIDTEAEYNTYLPVYRKIFNEVNADFLSICEFESPFWKNHSDYTTKRELFPNYAYYKDNATATSNGNWVAFFSHLPLSNVTEVPFNNYPTGAYRYYLVGDMVISGKNVKVVCTHLTHNTSGSGGSNAYAPLQILQLINDFQDYQNVVILADFNTAPAGFQPFKDAGYTMANNDFLGTLQTYWSTQWYEGAMDNIVVKGGSINNINVFDVNDMGVGNLSDHRLIYCDIVFE